MNCSLCNIYEDDPVEYGDTMKKRDLSVHYYCLLLSTNLQQRGKESSGILGFLIKDIKDEIELAQHRVCIYCDFTYATISCSVCKVYFHQICGLRNNCLFEFCGQFKSYCHQHQKIKHLISHLPNEGCVICFQAIGDYNPLKSILAKCCCNGWVHRRCIKEYALSAGYYLRCIFCKSSEFRDLMRLNGVFVPDRDAMWEKERGAFAGLHESYSRCDAPDCLCPKGRNWQNKANRWYILICNFCGSSGTHINCCKGKRTSDNPFVCAGCTNIFNRTKHNIDDHISAEEFSVLSGINRNVTLKSDMPDETLFVPKTFLFLETDANFGDSTMFAAPDDDSEDESRPYINRNFALITEKDEIVGFTEGYIKNELKKPNDLYEKADIILNGKINKTDSLLDNIIKEYIDLKGKDPKTINIDSSEEDESTEALIEKISNVPCVDVPKPKTN